MVSYREVRDFYERMPYPAPLFTLEEQQDLYHNPVRRATEFLLLWPTNPQRSNLDNVLPGILCTLGGWEDKLYRAIDGRRSMGEIISVNKTADEGRALKIFERLWQYDQIVFDASRGA
jgi:hypothetical protein